MTEICVQVFDDLTTIKKVLSKFNFKFVESRVNDNAYFTHISASELDTTCYQTLINNSIIVRNFKSSNVEDKSLIYKNKNLDKNQNVVSETKIKVMVDDTEKLIDALSGSGLTNWCNIAYDNHEYTNGEIAIYVQCVKNLGTFIEIEEYDSIKNLPSEEKFSKLCEFANSLNLKLGTDYSVKKAYLKFKSKN